MIISRQRLSRFLSPAFKQLPTDQLVQKLDDLGLAVASVTPILQDRHLDQVVLGKVIDWQKHPNADRLRLCKVSIGKETLPIVCGASNFDKGDIIVLAKVGAKLPNGMIIKAAKIRGETSQGMICSTEELVISGFDPSGIWNLSKEETGQMNLDKHLGQAFAVALGLQDTILDIEITPNRGDCVSYLGVARELQAGLGFALKNPYRNPSLPKVISVSESKMPFKITADPQQVPVFLLQVWKSAWSVKQKTPFEIKWPFSPFCADRTTSFPWTLSTS